MRIGTGKVGRYDDAIRLAGRTRTPEQPFFLFLPHASPHFPFQAPGDAALLIPDPINLWTFG